VFEIESLRLPLFTVENFNMTAANAGLNNIAESALTSTVRLSDSFDPGFGCITSGCSVERQRYGRGYIASDNGSKGLERCVVSATKNEERTRCKNGGGVSTRISIKSSSGWSSGVPNDGEGL
jgi:hypothetical protein